jgi:hypothetical protein
LLGGVVLLLLSAVMLLGFVRSGASFAAMKTLLALVIGVVLPAAGGLALLCAANRNERRGSARIERLRQARIDSEILRLAMLNAGCLTAADVASALALSPEEARTTLDGLVTRAAATLDVTDAGVLVYTFPDAKVVGDKRSARGLLDV